MCASEPAGGIGGDTEGMPAQAAVGFPASPEPSPRPGPARPRLRLITSDKPGPALGGRSPLRRASTLLREHWPLLVVCALAVALRAPFVTLINSQPTSDSYFYVTTAHSLAHGHGYVWAGHPTAFFPVGWPAFLAAAFIVTGSTSFHVVMWAGVALWTVSVGLMYVLGLRLGGRAAAIVAALIVAAYPDFVFASLRALSENLFVPLLIGVCILLVTPQGTRLSARRSAIAGALLGLAIMVRSTAVPLPLVISLVLFLRYRDVRSLRVAAVFVVVAYLAITPWVVRNALVMKTFAISTNGGYTLWLGDNPHATGSNQVMLKHHPRWALTSSAAEVRDNTIRTRESLHFIRHQFDQWLRLVWPKAVYLFRWRPVGIERATDAPVTAPQGQHGSRLLTGTEKALIDQLRTLYPLFRHLNAIWWYGAALAMVLAICWRRPGALLIGVIVGFWVLLHITLLHGQFRYLLSVEPLVAAPMAWCLVAPFAALVRWVQPRRPDTRLKALPDA